MAVKGKGKQIAGKSVASPSSSGKRKISHGDIESSGARTKKRSGILQFVDDAAKDADFEMEEEEEEDGDLEWEECDDFDFELPDIGTKEVKNVMKGPGKSTPLPFFIKEEEMNDDELEQAIKERYRGSGFVSFDEDIKAGNESEFVAHATKDLSVWRVKCMMGRERQVAFCLMQKFVDLQKIGKKLLIFSVFALDHVKGFVYIEADKVCDVFEACNGLCILYPSRVEFVPRNETPSLLSIQKKACAISKGTWVRMKNGKYKGDLSEVVFVNDAKKRVTIKLVPRIDLQAISKKFGGGTSLKSSATPAPRLISSHELEDFRPHIEIRRDHETGEVFEVLDGLMLKDGYLYKKVSMVSLIHWGVQPSSAELLKFEDTSKDEVKDVSWLSSIYKANPKKKLPETSNVTHGGKPNQKEGVKQRNGFDLDDLVLFGKKSCGIIVDMENDTFKILKGDLIGSEVVTINIREIKKKCIDKVFTATDRCMKTISIDDVVNVSEGPLEGRAGNVRHMYKGVLFIYDECQSENNGFFCAKSGICDLVKKSRDFSAGKLGCKGGPSFAQSPIIASEQEDDSQNLSRNKRNNNRGTFSVGQTLRICKGQLKGYLCRVIRIYRADITVKLDSLGKLLTVDETLLSFPNSKRDDATALQSGMSGNQEDQSTGGLMNEGIGLGMDNSDLNAGNLSFGRDSWNATSSSSFSFPTDYDSKDEIQGADPWRAKLPSSNGDQGHTAPNSWGKATNTVAENSWNKTGAEATNSSGKAPGTTAENSWNNTGAKKDAPDAWNLPSFKEVTSTDGWKSDNTCKKTDQNSSMEGASGGWARVVTAHVESKPLGEDGWSKTASKGPTVSNTETGGWGKTKVPCSDTGGSWNTKDSSEKGKSDGFGGQSGNWASSNSDGRDNQGSRDKKGKCILGTKDDIWGKSAAPPEKSTDWNQAAGWGSSVPSVKQVSAEKGDWGKALDGSQAAGWGSSATNASSSLSFEAGSQSNCWDNVRTPSSGGWGKPNETAIGTVAVSKSTTDGNKTTGWGTASAVNSSKPIVELDSQTSCWDNVSIPSSCSGWQKSSREDTTGKEGWKKEGFSSGGQIDGWNKEKTSGRDQSSGWNKAGNTEGGKEGSMDGWSKVKSSEGQGFGQESQREWKRGDASSKNSDWGKGSCWSQVNSDNENCKNSSQQRNFDSGRGSNRGRGRGRFEGRGGRNEDGDSGRGWRSGRGGGRGRNGGGGYNSDGSDAREFGRGRGRGRGREQGQGHFESSDWRNKQGSLGDGGFSSKPSSSWGAAGGSSWAKNRDEPSTGASNENAGWNSKKSYGGATAPSWGTDSRDADGSKKDINADHSSSWSEVASTGKQIDDLNKDDKNDNWINKTSSWNQMTTATEGDSKWNTSIATSCQPSRWKKSEIKSTNILNASEVSLTDWNTSSVKMSTNDWSQTSLTNKDKETADSQGVWIGKKVSAQVTNPSSENENNWGNSKGDVSGNPVSSKYWGGNNSENMDSGSTAWEARKEQSSSQSTWGGVEEDSSGNKSPDWNNGGNKWNKKIEGQGNLESWGHGSDIGRGGGRGRLNSFSSGRPDFGRGGVRGGRENSFSSRGGRGRGNSFATRGHGRNSEGRFGWSSCGDGSVQEGNGEKRSWKSEGGNQPAGWAKQASGWASAFPPVSMVEGGKGSWVSHAEPGSTRMTSGWESASVKEPLPSNVGASGWASEHGSNIEPKNDTQAKSNLPDVESMGNDKLDGGWADTKSDKLRSWNVKTSVLSASTGSTSQNSAWGGGQSNTGQVGGWERIDTPSEKSAGNDKLTGSWEDGNSSKPGSWDVLGPGLDVTTDSVAGSNDAAGKPDDSCGGDQNKSWGKAADSCGADHQGGNAGW